MAHLGCTHILFNTCWAVRPYCGVGAKKLRDLFLSDYPVLNFSTFKKPTEFD